MTYGAADRLVDAGIMVPSAHDWRVVIEIDDETTKKIRVSPSTLDEDEAIRRAMLHARIMDASAVKSIRAERVEKSVQVEPYGVIHK